jgi:hypothetical protein
MFELFRAFISFSQLYSYKLRLYCLSFVQLEVHKKGYLIYERIFMQKAKEEKEKMTTIEKPPRNVIGYAN